MTYTYLLLKINSTNDETKKLADNSSACLQIQNI